MVRLAGTGTVPSSAGASKRTTASTWSVVTRRLLLTGVIRQDSRARPAESSRDIAEIAAASRFQRPARSSNWSCHPTRSPICPRRSAPDPASISAAMGKAYFEILAFIDAQGLHEAGRAAVDHAFIQRRRNPLRRRDPGARRRPATCRATVPACRSAAHLRAMSFVSDTRVRIASSCRHTARSPPTWRRWGLRAMARRGSPTSATRPRWRKPTC